MRACIHRVNKVEKVWWFARLLVAFMESTPQSVQGAGKKSTQIKRKVYANPLPVGASSLRRSVPPSSRSWWDWFNDGTKWIAERVFVSPPVYHGCYDPLTNSVWMYEKGDSLKLWTQGFFGKGNLSRSEPTWSARRHAEKEAKRRGTLTAEQLTQKRREERKLLKIERARAAVRAGMQLPDGITALGGELREDDTKGTDGDSGSLWRGDEDLPVIEAGVSRVKGLKYFSDDVKKASSENESEDTNEQSEQIGEDEDDLDDNEITEHFQLTMIEAFFLAGMLGCLDVHDEHGAKLSLATLYQICMESQMPIGTAKSQEAIFRPDNPFLLSYIVYHYFRSLGWVVKTGTKFCVDFLLYKRGPVFSHAEFAVLVIPEYEFAPDAESSPFVQHYNAGNKSWIWFSMINRVNTQVQKVRAIHTDV